MSKVVINLSSKIPPYTTILVDNQPLKFENADDKTSKITSSFETSKSEVTLKIIRHSTLSTRLWFLYEMFFFFVCIFGIFDMHERLSFTVDCLCNLKINTTQDVNVTFQLLPTLVNGKVVKFVDDNNITVISNDYIPNEKLKKRKKISKGFKTAVIVGIAAFIIGIFALAAILGNAQ